MSTEMGSMEGCVWKKCFFFFRSVSVACVYKVSTCLRGTRQESSE